MFQDCTAFVFDLDGTLVTSDLDFPAMKAAVVRLAVARGVAPEHLAPLDILAAVEHACADGAGDGFRDEAEVALAAFEVEGASRNRAMPGAAETLAAISGRGWRVGIVTRNCRPAVERTLARIPLPHHALLTRSDVPHAKPHPDHLRRMLAALGAEPARAVMVGDHWMDVLAGNQAGMRTVGILGDHPVDRFDRLPPDLTLRHPSDLLAWLERCA